MKYGNFRCNQTFLRCSYIWSKRNARNIRFEIGRILPNKARSSTTEFKSVNILCEQFNKFVNTLKKEKEETKEKYPWLEHDDKRRNMTDKEILDKYIDKSCQSDTEKKEVMDMLYKCKDAFSVRDEIGTCSNIEVETDITDMSAFFIRPYHIKEEEKNILDKEMKRLCFLGILKDGFAAYSSPVMLISRKVTKEKKRSDRH